MRNLAVIAPIFFTVASFAATAASPPSSDFDRDGISDLVFQGSGDLKTIYYFSVLHPPPNGPRESGIEFINHDWNVAAVDDLDGDGITDLVWRNASTGENAVWHLTFGSCATCYVYRDGARILSVEDPNWSIVAAGDFNGDTKPDLVWRNRVTGENAIWYMNDSQYLGGERILSVDDPNWMIYGAADFDGDGSTDLVWRNDATGENAIWFMNGTAYAHGDRLNSVTDLTWKIGGTDDFDGDTHPDIAWHYQSSGSGYINVWFMNGSTYLRGQANVGHSDHPAVGPR